MQTSAFFAIFLPSIHWCHSLPHRRPPPQQVPAQCIYIYIYIYMHLYICTILHARTPLAPTSRGGYASSVAATDLNFFSCSQKFPSVCILNQIWSQGKFSDMFDILEVIALLYINYKVAWHIHLFLFALRTINYENSTIDIWIERGLVIPLLHDFFFTYFFGT